MEIAALVAFAQSPATRAEWPPASGDRLFDLWRSTSRPRLPLVNLNPRRSSAEYEELLNWAGVPPASAYISPVVQYWEHSALYRAGMPHRHLLVQLAVTADFQRVQVLIVEATSRYGLWEVDRTRVAYGSAKEFETTIQPIIAAASSFHGNIAAMQVCSHSPQAGIAIHIPYEIDVVREPRCPSGGASSVEAGKLVLAAAERIVGEKIERAAKFN